MLYSNEDQSIDLFTASSGNPNTGSRVGNRGGQGISRESERKHDISLSVLSTSKVSQLFSVFLMTNIDSGVFSCEPPEENRVNLSWGQSLVSDGEGYYSLNHSLPSKFWS